MSNLITQLAEIPMDKSLLNHLQLDQLFSNFAKNFRKLDDLKNFRSDYEKRNFISRWWDNDKLRDAQLDSAEVQAEFSKTLGQLVTVSIIQAKELTEQQQQLNEQQQQIGIQVDAVRRHSQSIEKQQEIQKDQAAQLEKVVADYIKVKGISDENIHRLARIVANIDQTKKEFFAESERVEQYLSTELANLSQQTQLITNALQEDVESVKTDTKNVIFSLKESFEKNHRTLAAGLQNIYQKQQDSEQNATNFSAKIYQEIHKLTESTRAKFTTIESLCSQISTHTDNVEAATFSSNQQLAALKSENASILSKQATMATEVCIIKASLDKTVKQLRIAVFTILITGGLSIAAISMQLFRL